MPNHVKNIITINTDDETLKKILNETQNDEVGIGSIDFDKLIPMPISLNIESGSTTDECIEIYLSSINPLVDYFGNEKVSGDEYVDIYNKLNSSKIYSKYNGNMTKEQLDDSVKELFTYGKNTFATIDDIFARGKAAIENVQKYGSKDWYGWAISQWGTKWNAYDFESGDNDNILVFSTACAAPNPILEALSKKYPEVAFSHSWADGDISVNLGKKEYLNGEIVDSYIPEGQSKEAYEMAAEIWGGELEDWHLRLSDDGTTYEHFDNEDDEDMEL